MSDTSFSRWFFGIGAKKCATTWTSQVLREHPEICMAPHKEIHYFTYNYHKGSDWYLRNFNNCGNNTLKGEFSTSYLYLEEAAERIQNFCKDAKIVVCLRNPADRLLSHYKHLLRNQHISQKITIRETIKIHPELLDCGQYYKYLKSFWDRFGGKNIILLSFEMISENPEKAVSELYQRLGVDSSFRPSVLNKVVSIGIIPKFSLLERIRVKLFYFLRDSGHSEIINFFRWTRIPEIYRRMNNAKEKQPRLSPDLRDEILTWYREDIEKLKGMTGFSCDHWT